MGFLWEKTKKESVTSSTRGAGFYVLGEGRKRSKKGGQEL